MFKPKNILLIMAMHDEAMPIIKDLNLKRQGNLNINLPMQFYSGLHKGIEINLLLNGICKTHKVDHIGSQAATLATHLGIEGLKPDIVINAGTAGGFKSDAASVGDVYLGFPFVCFHDRRINIPNFFEYGIGKYPCFPCESIAHKLGLRLGVVSTGNSLDYTLKDLEVMQSYKGVVKDMEAAAIAWVAELYNIPFLAIKAITDIVDGDKPTEDEFIENLSKASKILCNKTIKVLEEIEL